MCQRKNDDDAEGTAPAPPPAPGTHPAERYTATPEEAAEALASWAREQLDSRPCPYDGMYGPHDHIPGADSEVCIVAAEQPNREQNDLGAGVPIFSACFRWCRNRWRDFGDWLDPLRVPKREWHEYLRSRLDGGDPGAEGRKR